MIKYNTINCKLDHKTLEQLTHRIIIPNINKKCNSEQLIEKFHDVLKFITIEEWKEMTEILNNYFNQNDTDMIYEIAEKIKNLPSYDVILDKLGEKRAEEYVGLIESIPKGEVFIDVNIDYDMKFRKNKVVEIFETLKIISDVYNDESVKNKYSHLIEKYKKYIKDVKSEIRYKKQCMRENNASIIELLQEYNIWFPYNNDKEKWTKDIRVKDRGAYFIELSKQVENLMKEQKCVIQYIRRRRITKNSIKDLERNIESLSMYLNNFLIK